MVIFHLVFNAILVPMISKNTFKYGQNTYRMSVLFLYQTVTNPVIFWNLTLLYLHSIINSQMHFRVSRSSFEKFKVCPHY
jgi:hypothetical protein